MKSILTYLVLLVMFGSCGSPAAHTKKPVDKDSLANVLRKKLNADYPYPFWVQSRNDTLEIGVLINDTDAVLESRCAALRDLVKMDIASTLDCLPKGTIYREISIDRRGIFNSYYISCSTLDQTVSDLRADTAAVKLRRYLTCRMSASNSVFTTRVLFDLYKHYNRTDTSDIVRCSYAALDYSRTGKGEINYRVAMKELNAYMLLASKDSQNKHFHYHDSTIPEIMRIIYPKGWK